jgi:hypothetical protein
LLIYSPDPTKNVSNRCRIVFGMRPDGTPRYFAILHVQDVAEGGVLLRAVCLETFSGGH